jgi:hypothetical protein
MAADLEILKTLIKFIAFLDKIPSSTYFNQCMELCLKHYTVINNDSAISVFKNMTYENYTHLPNMRNPSLGFMNKLNNLLIEYPEIIRCLQQFTD